MPVVTIGNNTGDDFSGTTNVQIHEGEGNLDGQTLEMSKFDTADWRHTLIAFTGISNLPSSITVNAASLHLNQINAGVTPVTITVRRLLRNWVETQADYNVYSTGNAWTTPGGLSNGNDRASTASGSTSVDDSGGFKTFSGSDAQFRTDIANFASGTFPNYGWHLERTDGQNDGQFRVYESSETGSDGNRPYLTIDYTAGGGTQHYEYTASGGMTMGGTATKVKRRTSAATGGVTMSGTATKVRRRTSAATGGLTMGGAATFNRGYRFSATGGLTMAGAAAPVRRRTSAAAGGLVLAGAATLEFENGTNSYEYTASGGLTLGGTSSIDAIRALTATGGLVMGGTAVYSNHESTRTIIASGGLTMGGAATVSTFTAGGGDYVPGKLYIAIDIGI